jgi:hypothetical protein
MDSLGWAVRVFCDVTYFFWNVSCLPLSSHMALLLPRQLGSQEPATCQPCQLLLFLCLCLGGWLAAFPGSHHSSLAISPLPIPSRVCPLACLGNHEMDIWAPPCMEGSNHFRSGSEVPLGPGSSPCCGPGTGDTKYSLLWCPQPSWVGKEICNKHLSQAGRSLK